MCGIDVILSTTSAIPNIPSELLSSACVGLGEASEATERRKVVANRGPDYNNSVAVTAPSFHLDIFGSVLQIQGKELCRQPLVDVATGSILLWNGEYLNHEDSEKSDSVLIMSMLLDCKDSFIPVHALDRVEGPFAFVFFNAITQTLWFGKDKQGRRSLLFRHCETCVTVSSVGLVGGVEVPAGAGIYSVSLTNPMSMEFHPWVIPCPYSTSSFLTAEDDVCDETAAINDLHRCLYNSIEKHMHSTTVASPLGISFSGGLDSTIIADIAIEIFLRSLVNRTPLSITEIHLINVGVSDACPDRRTGLVSYDLLLKKFGQRMEELGIDPFFIIKFIIVTVEEAELASVESRILDLSFPNDSLMDFNISAALWFGSRGSGRLLDGRIFKDPFWIENFRDQIIIDESTESAVENKTSKKVILLEDRLSAAADPTCSVCHKFKLKLGCAKNICKLCCLKEQRRDAGYYCIVHKARGKDGVVGRDAVGREDENSSTLPGPLGEDGCPSLAELINRYISISSVFVSSHRVLLVGHGADELFGGYGRHETRIKKFGVHSLRSEMSLDLQRLWRRNLGRDDRVLGDHGRDVRHPYLDVSVVGWVGSHSVVDSGKNKYFLRRVCAEKLGLHAVSNFRKRAIQFGTRLAQRTNVALFGSHSKGSGEVKMGRGEY